MSFVEAKAELGPHTDYGEAGNRVHVDVNATRWVMRALGVEKNSLNSWTQIADLDAAVREQMSDTPESGSDHIVLPFVLYVPKHKADVPAET